MKKPRKNLFTYSPNHFFTKPGFTLAEVLIVISIIGVVAALTIPTLMTNVRAQQYRTAFKKAISTFSQAARMGEAKYDLNYANAIECTSLDDSPENVNSFCALWNGTLTGVKLYEKASDIKMKDGGGYYIDDIEYRSDFDDYGALQLQDGTILITLSTYNYLGPKTNDTDLNGNIRYCTIPENETIKDFFNYPDLLTMGCLGWIDVNGVTGPNKEVSCTTGTNSSWDKSAEIDTPCTVSSKDVTDVYPVYFHDGIMEPATNAGRAVLQGK